MGCSASKENEVLYTVAVQGEKLDQLIRAHKELQKQLGHVEGKRGSVTSASPAAPKPLPQEPLSPDLDSQHDHVMNQIELLERVTELKLLVADTKADARAVLQWLKQHGGDPSARRTDARLKDIMKTLTMSCRMMVMRMRQFDGLETYDGTIEEEAEEEEEDSEAEGEEEEDDAEMANDEDETPHAGGALTMAAAATSSSYENQIKSQLSNLSNKNKNSSNNNTTNNNISNAGQQQHGSQQRHPSVRKNEVEAVEDWHAYDFDTFPPKPIQAQQPAATVGIHESYPEPGTSNAANGLSVQVSSQPGSHANQPSSNSSNDSLYHSNRSNNGSVTPRVYESSTNQIMNQSKSQIQAQVQNQNKPSVESAVSSTPESPAASSPAKKSGSGWFLLGGGSSKKDITRRHSENDDKPKTPTQARKSYHPSAGPMDLNNDRYTTAQPSVVAASSTAQQPVRAESSHVGSGSSRAAGVIENRSVSSRHSYMVASTSSDRDSQQPRRSVPSDGRSSFCRSSDSANGVKQTSGGLLSAIEQALDEEKQAAQVQSGSALNQQPVAGRGGHMQIDTQAESTPSPIPSPSPLASPLFKDAKRRYSRNMYRTNSSDVMDTVRASASSAVNSSTNSAVDWRDQKAVQLEQQRQEYLEYLEQVRRQGNEATVEQQQKLSVLRSSIENLSASLNGSNGSPDGKLPGAPDTPLAIKRNDIERERNRILQQVQQLQSSH